MNKYVERLYNGIWKENPIFVQMLGLCPTLAVTTSAINGVGMGLSTTAVLIAANFLIALLRKIIPDGVRLPAEIVVVASFVTIVDMLMEGFVPSLYASLGLYIPLIVVNCIILGRAEAYAMKNGPILSAFDGIGMGLGFTVALALIGSFRELLGAGTIFGVQIMPASYPADLNLHSGTGCILRSGCPDCSSESSEDAVCNKRFRKREEEGWLLQRRLLKLCWS